MIESVYRKDGSYYPKVFLEKFDFNNEVEYSDGQIQITKIKCIDLYLEKTSKIQFFFVFEALQVRFWNIRKTFLILGQESSIS